MKPAAFLLPRFDVLKRYDDPPQRNRLVAAHTWRNVHGVKFQARVLTNNGETRWWVNAVLVDLHMRASGTLSTSSKRRAAEWIAAVKAGNVDVEAPP